MRFQSLILGLVMFGFFLADDSAAQRRDRDADGRRREPDARWRQDDQWFDPDWWHEWSPPERDWSPGWRRDGRWRSPFRGPRSPGPRQVTLGIVYDDTAAGIRIRSVVPGSPAQRAGLRRGDYLLQMDGRRLWSAADVRRMLQYRDPGERIRVTFDRRGRIRQTTIRVRSRRALFG